MKDNWEEISRRLPAGLSMLGSMVTICTSSFTSEAQKESVSKFFEGQSTKGFDMPLAQSLETIQAKSAWLTRDREDVAKWVKENVGGSTVKSEL